MRLLRCSPSLASSTGLSRIARRPRLHLRLGVAIVAVGLGALAVLDAEQDARGANITNYGDALWWASTTVTTVGYGDHFPVTTEGRLVALAAHDRRHRNGRCGDRLGRSMDDRAGAAREVTRGRQDPRPRVASVQPDWLTVQISPPSKLVAADNLNPPDIFQASPAALFARFSEVPPPRAVYRARRRRPSPEEE